jgi:hypothetical protein
VFEAAREVDETTKKAIQKILRSLTEIMKESLKENIEMKNKKEQ